MNDPFALPPASPKATKTIRAAVAYSRERTQRHADARDIIKGLVQHHGATVIHLGYRTAFRCGGIYTEAAACCDLRIAKALLSSFAEKAERYLGDADTGDLFEHAG